MLEMKKKTLPFTLRQNRIESMKGKAMDISLSLFVYRCGFVAFVLLMISARSTFGYDILMFGDSLTQGYQRTSSLQVYGITSPPNGSRVDGSYGPQLERLLSSMETSYAFNWGWKGERTSTGVNRIDSVLASRPADYILILEGGNDIIQGLSLSTAWSNLGYMVDKAKNAGIEPILSEMVPITTQRYPGGDRMSAVYKLSELVNSLAEEKGVMLSTVLYPLLAGWDSVPYQSGDGVHLGDRGYILMADEWYKAIKRHIESVPGGSTLPAIFLLLKKK